MINIIPLESSFSTYKWLRLQLIVVGNNFVLFVLISEIILLANWLLQNFMILKMSWHLQKDNDHYSLRWHINLVGIIWDTVTKENAKVYYTRELKAPNKIEQDLWNNFNRCIKIIYFSHRHKNENSLRNRSSPKWTFK